MSETNHQHITKQPTSCDEYVVSIDPPEDHHPCRLEDVFVQKFILIVVECNNAHPVDA